uniref:Endonuclease/exonuclease/phosphatase domain-containing protein n=1 Tax=Cannabis sativa TaxID=3483 RepID=A0A803QJP7_CANSA
MCSMAPIGLAFSFMVLRLIDRAVLQEARILEILALNHPWVLVGDLNIISGQIDKFGGRSVEEGEGHHLTELMNVTGGVDLGCTGNFFTWSNGRSLPNLVKERLDRAICDPEWIIRYPKAGVKSLVIKESDHAPVMLDLLFDRERVKAGLDIWIVVRDASCKVIIKEEKLKALNRLLLEVQQRTPSDVNLKLEADIILEMEEVETRQAEIWKQKSRELWYKDGDRNTRFFHAATVIKRKRNFIETITPDGLEWISGRNAVGNYFRDKFISVLSSSSPPSPLLQHLIRPLISWECTSDLMVFMPYEIKEVVWSMHP